MSIQLDILKYGYCTAANNNYLAIGNPSPFYTSSYVGTGSVFIYQYSLTTDNYEYLNKLKKSYSYTNDLLLASDTSSLNETLINADTSSVVNGLNIILDTPDFSLIPVADGYGISVSISSSILVVGCPYFYYSYLNNTPTIKDTASIEIFNLSDISTNSSPTYIIYNSSSLDINDTFGESVSISYNNFLSSSVIVVGSSGAKENTGSIYIFTQSLNSWDLYQTIYGQIANGYFGYSVKYDLSGSNRIVVGNKSTGSAVYVYEFNNSTNNWTLNDTLNENRTITGSLNFIDFKPYFPGVQPSGSKYGNSVSIYGDTVIVGSPDDMYYYEWSGSTVLRNRGAVYFWKKCTDATDWFLLQKSFGSEDLLESNNFGKSVDIYNGYAVATSNKDIYQFSSSYIKNTINKRFNCNPDDDVIDTLGQFVFYTSSLSNSLWEVKNTVTKKKQYGYPYTTFGYSCAITDKIISIGSPLFLVNPIEMTSSLYDTINGYSYIYNFNDLVNDYHIGNVFYRDGKIILSNSGSIFDNLLKNRSNLLEPMYNIEYKSNIKLYEKQVLCRIEPGEFNYSTNPTSLIPNSFDFDIDNNKYFDFTDLDLILKYINYQVNSSYSWWNYMTFTNDEQSVFNFYASNYNISSSYTSTYDSILNINYNKFDIDGNNKVNVNDMYLLWKYFCNNLNQTELFKYVEPKSSRKTLQQVTSYIDQKIGKFGSKNVKQDFFNFNYSSSIDPTGSYLAPYVTTVGLYSGADLVAVAKLGMPIKNSGELPLNILVKWDI